MVTIFVMVVPLLWNGLFLGTSCYFGDYFGAIWAQDGKILLESMAGT